MVMQGLRQIGMPDSGYPDQPDADAIIKSVDDEFLRAMDVRTPLLELTGGLSGFTADSVKHFYTQGQNWARRLSSHGGFADTTTTSWTMTAQANGFPVGTVFKIESELVRITGHTDVNTVVVTRGYAGTTPAIHTSAREAIVSGSSMSEGDTWVYRPTPTISLPYNYCQMDHTALSNTWRRQSVRLYGRDGATELAELVDDTLREKTVAIEGNLISGQRFAGEGSEPATAGGLEYFVTSANGSDVVDKNGSVVQPSDFTNMLDRMAKKIGEENLPTLAIMDSWAKQKMSAYFAGSKRLRQEERVGGTVIDTLETEWGNIRMMMNNSLPAGNIYMINTENVRTGHLGAAGLLHFGEIMRNDGPFSGMYIYTDFTHQIKRLWTFGRIHNFSLSS